ncbi:hypothetical protein AYJ54_07895 [Bradyrhizobium centrolobii]|uniref:Uncharacterized protein n=1 Tax=Bradyrhizobium centrolobii TaxID=1505087 RepID=A0A176YYB9_9BRAD|nr:hypothetical protein [Bradyrhizobium centrolobii]OAF11773.1 hypothetical protein AYJ54_07895 [Bradyrhizobium centrolobii]
MTDAFESFLAEMRAVPCLAGEIPDQLEAAFEITKADALRNKHARSFLAALRWVAGHREKSIVERLDAILKLTAFEGPVVGSITRLVGWT